MKKIALFILSLIMIIAMIPFSAVTVFAASWDGVTPAEHAFEGEGTELVPYLIKDGADLAYLSSTVKAGTNYSGIFFKQTANIDLGGQPWTPIGTSGDAAVALPFTKPFSGTYDGDGYTITNILIESGTYVGLFGCVTNATIKNVNVTNSSITGTANNGTTASRSYAGGIVSCMSGGSVYACTTASDVSVIANLRVGGIASTNLGGTISYCINGASVNQENTLAASSTVGGIVAMAGASSTISYCINNGDVTGNHTGLTSFTSKWSAIGGIAGCAGSSSSYTNIDHCFNTGAVSSTCTGNTIAFVGGIAGAGYQASTYSDSYSSGTVSNATNPTSTVLPTKITGKLIGYLNLGTFTLTNLYSSMSGEESLVARELTAYDPQKATVEYKADLTSEMNGIKSSIKGVLKSHSIYKGVQESSVIDNLYNIRFVAVIDSLTYDEIGFKVKAEYTENSLPVEKDLSTPCTSVYSSLTGKLETRITAYSAADLGGNYLMALCIKNIPANVGEITFTLTPYTVNDGIVTYGVPYTIIYNAGSLNSQM